MTSVKDIHEVLNYFVKNSSPEEDKFSKEMESEGIKVCDRLYYVKDGGGNKMRLISKLEDSRSSSALLRSKSDKTSEFYIKEVKFSQASKSKYLDGEGDTNFTTIVANRNSQIEAVYNASISYAMNGGKLVKHESYLRASNKPNSLSGTLRRTQSHNDKTCTLMKEEPKKVKKPKLLKFPSIKKNKKNEVNLEEINKLVETLTNQNKKVMNAEEIKKLSKEKKKKDTKNTPVFTFGDKGNIPFEGYSIGSLGTTKSLKKGESLLNMFKYTGTENIKAQSRRRQPTKEYSTTLVGTDTKTVVATLDSDNDVFTYETDNSKIFNEDDTVIDEVHIDLPPIKKASRKMSCPNVICDCVKQNNENIAKAFIQMLENKPKEEIEKLFTQYNEDTRHYGDCPNSDIPFIEKDWRQSTLSLYQDCETCDNIDDHLSPGICTALLPMIDEIEEGEKVELTEDYLDFFITSKCYTHFENGLKQSLGVKCTPYNLARLHDTARRIVRHIGDPNRDVNQHIKRILRYVEEFYISYFNNHIMDYHESVVDFLLNCHCDNYDQVD